MEVKINNNGFEIQCSLNLQENKKESIDFKNLSQNCSESFEESEDYFTQDCSNLNLSSDSNSDYDSDSDSDEWFECKHQNCRGGPYKKAINLALHVRKRHSKTMPRPFTCKYEGCKSRFGTNSTRIQHHRTHKIQKYFCKHDGCKEGFSNQQKRWRHEEYELSAHVNLNKKCACINCYLIKNANF